MNFKTEDLRIQSIDDVITPAQLHEEIPISAAAAKLTYETRLAVHHLLHGHDDRLLAIVGPCSVHDPKAALEYAAGLEKLIGELSEQLIVVMRVYFEKPRTTVGWKGLINDPDLDGSFNINKGLRCARKLLLDLNDMGCPRAASFSILSRPNTSPISSPGAPSARAPPKVRFTVNSLPDFPVPSGSRTAPTVIFRLPWMLFGQLAIRTIFFRSPWLRTRQFSSPAVTKTRI